MLNSLEAAALYAAQKGLEEQLGNLPPGTYPVGGLQVIVTLAPDTQVVRSPGPHGNGLQTKNATQNLYGYAVWCRMLFTLAKFRQDKAVLKDILMAWEEAVTTPSTTTEAEMLQQLPELAELMNRLKKMPKPQRTEPTPRMLQGPKAKCPSIKIVPQPLAQAA